MNDYCYFVVPFCGLQRKNIGRAIRIPCFVVALTLIGRGTFGDKSIIACMYLPHSQVNSAFRAF